MRGSTAKLITLCVLLLLAFPFLYPLSRTFFRGAPAPSAPESHRSTTAVKQGSTAAAIKPEWNLTTNTHRFLDSESNDLWWLDSTQWLRRIEDNGVDAVISELHAAESQQAVTFARALQQSAHILREYPEQAWLQVYCRTRAERTNTIDRMLGSPPSTVTYLPRFVSGNQIGDRLLQTLQMERGQNDIAITPDGKTLITDAGSKFSFWDVATGKSLKTLDSGRVLQRVMLSPDGNLLAGGRNFPLLPTALWDLAANEKVSLPEPLSCGFDLAFSPDSRRLLALGSTNGVYRTFGVLYDLDAQTGRQLDALKGLRVTKAVYLEDPERIVIGTTKTAVIYDPATDQVIDKTEPSGEVFSIAYSSAANLFAIATLQNSRIRLYNATTLEPTKTFDADPGLIEFSPSGTALALIDLTGRITLWTVDDTTETYVGQHGSQGSAIKFSPDGKHLLTAANDHRIKVWRIAGPASVASSHPLPTVARLSPDGRRIACGSKDGRVRVWDAITGEGLGAFSLAAPVDQKRIVDLAFTPDNKKLCVVGNHKSIEVWDLSRYALMKTIRAPALGFVDRFGASVRQVLVAADGKSIFTAEGGRARQYQLDTGKLLTEYVVDKSASFVSASKSIAVAETGKLLASAHTREIRLWDMQTAQRLRTIAANRATHLHFVDADSLAAIEKGKLKIWSTTSGEVEQSIAGCTVMDLSRDGSQVVTGAEDGFVRLWDLETKREQHAFCVGDAIRAIQWNDDRSLTALDASGAVHLFDPVQPR